MKSETSARDTIIDVMVPLGEYTKTKSPQKYRNGKSDVAKRSGYQTILLFGEVQEQGEVHHRAEALTGDRPTLSRKSYSGLANQWVHDEAKRFHHFEIN